MFKEGDLVFAKCVKSWPAKIIKVFNETTFKVDFYNHNSFAIVDQKDLEIMSETNIQYYRQKYQKKKNNEEVLAFQGIRLAEIQFKRRQELHKIESKKWSQGIPNGNQKKQFEQKMKKQIKRPVYKPKQSDKKQSQRGQKNQQQNKTQIKTRIKKDKKTNAIKNQEKLHEEVRTRSKSAKSQTKVPKQTAKKELKDSSKQQRIQGGQKDQHKQKKIKKKPKKKMSKKQKKQTKITNLKQKENKKILELSENKAQNIPTQNLQTTQQLDEIKLQNLSNSKQDGLQSSSMVAEQKSFSQSPFTQNSQEMVMTPTIGQNERITTKSLNENIEHIEGYEIHSAPIPYLNQSYNQVKRNKIFQAVVEKDRNQQNIQKNIYQRVQQANPAVSAESNPNPRNQEERDNIIEAINQPLVSTDTVQEQNNNEMQIQENIHQEQKEPYSQQKMTVMNNLDLSISSFEISISQENIDSNNNTAKNVSPQQTQQQHQTYPQNIQQINQQTVQPQTQIMQQPQSQIIPIVEEKPNNTQHPQMAMVTSDNIYQEEQQNQHKTPQINESSQNEVMQSQMNVPSQNQSNSQESITELENLQEDDYQLQANQNQEFSKAFQNLTPVAPNLLYQIINHKISQPTDNPKINLDQSSQHIAVQQPQKQVQPSNTVQADQNQQKNLSVNSSIVATNVNTYELDLKEIQIDSNKPEDLDKSCRYFERIYGDFSINNRDYIKMVRGLPQLKKELQNTDCKLMAICINQYLRILFKFIAPQNSQKQMKNLQMWQRQLLIAILDTDILNLKILVQYEIMFNMMSFISAFEQNRTPKRAQCHVEYLFVVSRMDTYLNRYIRQRYKEGLMHKSSSYDQLIRQFNQRVHT